MDLKGAGFVINIEKSVLVPTCKIECLGFVLDTYTYTVAVGQDKIDTVGDMVGKLLAARHGKHAVMQ